jgi:hypothetical protein
MSAMDRQLCADTPPEIARTIDQIMSAWQKRMDRVKSARFSWQETYITLAGTESVEDEYRRLHDPKLERKYPPEDTMTERTCELLIDGRKGRWTKSGPTWSAIEAAFTQQTLVAVFDGTVPKTHRRREEDGEFSWGYVDKTPYYQDEVSLFPTLLTYRVEPHHFKPAMPYRWQLRQAVVRGKQCLELKRTATNGRGAQSYSFDPSCDWVLCRYSSESFAGGYGQPLLTMSISYRDDKGHGPLPDSWEYSLYSRGRVDHTLRARMTDCIINESIDSSEFEYDFPPATIIQDGRTDTMSLVRHDGTIRPISRDEMIAGVTYKEMLYPTRWRGYLGAAVIAAAAALS